MSELERIWLFLRAVRLRARRENALRYAGLAVVVGCVVLGIMAAGAASSGPASFWPVLTTGVLLAVTAAVVLLGVVLPMLRLRSTRAVARLVGRREPAVASDLLSAVELAEKSGAPEGSGVSGALTNAFFGDVATRCAALDPRRLVPLERARLMAALAALSLIALGVLAFAGPLQRGARMLVHKPTRFEGAAVSAEPLVGDVRVSYEYPAVRSTSASIASTRRT